MNGDVGAAVEDGLLHFLGEHSLPADRVQLRSLIAVAGRRDQHVLDLASEQGTDALGLPTRERAGARRDPDHSDSTVGSVGRSKSETSASA